MHIFIHVDVHVYFIMIYGLLYLGTENTSVESLHGVGRSFLWKDVDDDLCLNEVIIFILTFKSEAEDVLHYSIDLISI